jgi:PQQ-dependent dehydrogenase (methanol/ethanol family)
MRIISIRASASFGIAIAMLWWAASTGAAGDARSSALSAITTDNVAQLKLIFSFQLPANAGYAAIPQTVGDTLFVLTPFPHTLYALEAYGAAAGSVKWRYSPDANPAAAALRSAGPRAFGPALSGDAVYFNTLDGRTVALEAATGRVKWDQQLANFGAGETLGSAPLVVGKTVVIGNAGDDFGARGWIKALDRDTGQELWRKYSTGSDADVGVGPSFRSFYRSDNATELGMASWPPDAWQHGGGTVSGLLSYDPGLDQVVHGTGHPAPGNPEQRPGDNRWTSGLFARDSATGSARWFTPLNPHDLYGLGATNANVLVDRDWRGTKRPLLIHANANGFLYVLDRRTGEILSAEPFAPGNMLAEINIGTAAPRWNDAKSVRGDKPVRDVCPAAPGAAVGAPAYSERLGLLFIPTSFLCMDVRALPVGYIPGTPYSGVTRRLKPMPESPRGAQIAWDVENAKPAWSIRETFPVEGGALATAGDLVFYGTLDGWLRAADSRNGHILWEYKTKTQIAGQPITYSGPDNRQYVAVVAGLSSGGGAVGDEDIDTRDLTAANGFANALPDLPRPAEASARLYVFGLQ